MCQHLVQFSDLVSTHNAFYLSKIFNTSALGVCNTETKHAA